MSVNNLFLICDSYIFSFASSQIHQVQRVLKVLEKPFSVQEGLEQPGLEARGGAAAPEERDETGEEARVLVPYDSKPPIWANEICVT